MFIDLDISDDKSGIASAKAISSNGVSFATAPILVSGVYLNGTFRQQVTMGRLRGTTYYMAVVLTDYAGNVATYPLKDVYVFGPGKGV